MLKRALVSSCAKGDNKPIDYGQLIKFIRYDLDVDLIKRAMDNTYIYDEYKKKFTKDTVITNEEVFAILLKSMTFYNTSFIDRASKFQLPVFVDGRYCCIISFDEKDIHHVIVMASKNMYDIKEPIKFIRVDTDTNFDKSLFML